MMLETVSKAYFQYISSANKILSWVKQESTQLAEEKNFRRKQIGKANQTQTYAI